MRPRHQAGWIQERGTRRKYFYGTFYVYVKDASGNDVSKRTGEWLGWKSEMTKGEAREKLRNIIFERTGKGTPTDKLTLSWFWENRFLVARKSGWSDATLCGNLMDWKCYVAPGLGKLKLSEIEPFVMQAHFNQLAAEGYCGSVITKSKTLLSSVLCYAVDLKFLPANPMVSASGKLAVRMPKVKRREKPVLTDNQMAQLILSLPIPRDRLILAMAYHYGLSAEEVFGLTWDCVGDFSVHIRNVAWRGKLYRDTTKRDARRRDLPLNPGLAAMLISWREESGGAGDAVVFPGRDGHPMWGNTWLKTHIMPIAKSLGIKNVTFQIMRRSFGTDNLARDPKSTQAIMGHSKLDVTANIYAQAQMEKMSELLDARWMRLGLGKTKGVQ